MLEMQRGVALPVHAYPLLENALRAANGWTLKEHATRIGALWSRFSEVAAGNPHAWIRTARTPSGASPYTRSRLPSSALPAITWAVLKQWVALRMAPCAAIGT